MTVQVDTSPRGVAREITNIIGDPVLETVGGTAFMAMGFVNEDTKSPIGVGVSFAVRLLPFDEHGVRSNEPEDMFAEIRKTDEGLFNVIIETVNNRRPVHFYREGVPASDLSALIAALVDWDGEDTLNPKVFSVG